MALASTSLVQMQGVEELVYGETPIAGSSFEIRCTGESFNYTISEEVSGEINQYRANTSKVPVSAESGGTLNCQMQYGEYDRFFQAALQDSWDAYGVDGIGAAFSATFATGTITAAVAPTGASAFSNLSLGQWFTVTGTGTANDNKLFRVHPTTVPTTTVVTLDPGTPGVAGGPYAATVLKSSRLSNGTNQRSFSLERKSIDTGEFFVFTGQTVSAFSLSIADGSLSTLDFTFMGKASDADTSSFLPGTPAVSSAYQIMSGVSGTSCALWVNGAPLTSTFVKSISLNYDNALRMQNAICFLGSIGIGSGTIALKVDLEIYFATGKTFFAEFLNNENIELSFTAFDSEGNGYVFTIPQANVDTYNVSAGGKDQDMMVSVSLEGLLDLGNPTPTLRKVMFMDRLGAALDL